MWKASWVVRAASGTYLSAEVEVVGVRAISSGPGWSGEGDEVQYLFAAERVRVWKKEEAFYPSLIGWKLNGPRWFWGGGVGEGSQLLRRML